MSQRWHAPQDLPSALELLQDDAELIAGGVSLVLFMNLGFLEPVDLVSLAAIPELHGVRRAGGEIVVGAMETHDQLSKDPTLGAVYPAAARMFAGVGNPRVRAWGTLGGNLAHADPAQDPPVMLTALGAHADIVGANGPRSLPVEQLATGPLSVDLDEGEIITSVRIPVPASPPRTAYIKFLPGTQDDYATVSVAAALDIGDDGVIDRARLAAGSVGPTTVPLLRSATALEGQRPDPDVLQALHEAVRDEVSPTSDRRGSADYKREMAGVMAQRAVDACRRAPTTSP